MAKFHGRVGFGISQETEPGVFEDTVVERAYFGDIVKNTRTLRDGENLNANISVNNSISIVADAYASENFVAMKYVEWSGALWTVTEVDVQRPRLLLRLGEVWNGNTA